MKTKQIIFTAALTLSAFATTFAQEAQWGVKAGYNLSSLSGASDGVEVESLSGFHAGAVSEFKLTERFSLQPELLFSLEGAKSSFEFEEEGFFISTEQKLKLGYINLPVMAKVYVADGFSLEAGPQVGYLVSGKADYEMTTNVLGEGTMSDSGTMDIKEELKSISFGANVGLGYQLPNNLFFQARYHIGLSDISENEADSELEMGKIKNSGFQFSLGYKF